MELNTFNLQLLVLFFFRTQYISNILKDTLGQGATHYCIAGRGVTPKFLIKSALSKAGTLSSPICSFVSLEAHLYNLKETWQPINFMGRLQLKTGNHNHLNYLNVHTSQSRWNEFKAFQCLDGVQMCGTRVNGIESIFFEAIKLCQF